MAATDVIIEANEVSMSKEQLISDGIFSNIVISNSSGNLVPFKLIENSDRVWISLLQNPEIFGDNNSYIRGFVNGPDELESILEAHKRATTSSYSVRTSNSKRDKSGIWKKNIQPVFVRSWEPKMKFDYTPFIVVKITYMECEFGRGYWRKDKKQNDDHNYHNLPDDSTIESNPVPGSRKRGCLARLTVWEVFIFTEYKISNWGDLLAHQLREVKSQKLEELRKRLHNKEDVPYKKRFFLELPFKSAHKNHDFEVSDGLQLRVHPKIINRIHQHVRRGTTNREEVKSLIDTFVKQELSGCGVEPNPLDRSYHPTDRDLANHIYRAINIEKFKRIDHSKIHEKVSSLQGSSTGQRILYQPTTEKALQKGKEKSEDDTLFMLLYQEAWQINLMKSRLKVLYVIDSTYRTLKYPLPLYTVWIYTDEKFICVATIIIQCDTTDDLAQALQYLRSWNPDWQPDYFLLDAQQQCWKAVEQTFPESKVFVSSFHCNQAWSQFLASTKLNLRESSRLHIYSLLQRAANSSSKEGYAEAVDMIQTTQEWKSSDYLRYIINRFWFHNSSKWAMSSQPEELVLAMSGSAQDKLKYALEYDYLPHIWNKTVSVLIELLSEKFFPEVVRTDGELELINMEQDFAEIVPNEIRSENIGDIGNKDNCDDGYYDLKQTLAVNSNTLSKSGDAKLALIKREIKSLCKEIDVMTQSCSQKESLVKVVMSLRTFKKDLLTEITKDFRESQKRGRKQRTKMLKKVQKRHDAEHGHTSDTVGSKDTSISRLSEPAYISNIHTFMEERVIHLVHIDQTEEPCDVPRVAEAVEISLDHSEMIQ
ncbi:uncharacterized protein LOC117102824 [Anneissia japonica]|uniref:uncharacterized protein LOC117102824 n=1 Tax=Anneissia japonica TaxID=1529436 RepID=UPI001425B695|nr:uncharacterized protein LOC117102824 [Anneissia japonica]